MDSENKDRSRNVKQEIVKSERFRGIKEKMMCNSGNLTFKILLCFSNRQNKRQCIDHGVCYKSSVIH